MGEYADLAVDSYINSFRGLGKYNTKRNKAQKPAHKRKAEKSAQDYAQRKNEMKCSGCGKLLTKEMQLERSVELSETYCSFDCGVNRLVDHCRMAPIKFEDAVKFDAKEVNS